MSNCDIKTIPDVSLGDINWGNLFHVSFQQNYNESPSIISASYINKEGKYPEPKLSLEGGYILQMPGLNPQPWYPITSTLNESSSQGKTLEVKYIDGSFILDRKYVGLHRRHGDKNNNPYDFLILVGQDINPCDTNKDGKLDNLDLDVNFRICLPCTSGLGFIQLNTDCNMYDNSKIFDVNYRFSDLLSAMSGKGVSYELNGILTGNSGYFNQFSGPLRSVLSSWGNELGFSFFWDNNKLQFLDLRSGIDINFDTSTYEGVLEVTKTRSLEGTISRAAMSYYQREGVYNEEINQKTEVLMNLRPIQLSDLYATVNPDYLHNLEISASLIRYSPGLRDTFWFYYVYGLVNSASARASITTAPFYTDNDNFFHHLGNMRILDVLDDTVNDDYELLLSVLDYKERDNFVRNEGFFILAYKDSVLDNQLKEEELRLSNEFIGNYFGRVAPIYTQTHTYSAPDGNVEYYNIDTSIKSVPLFDFNYQPGSWIESLIKPILESNPGLHPWDAVISGYGTSNGLVLLKKQPRWYPNPSDLQQYEEFINYWGNRLRPIIGPNINDYKNKLIDSIPSMQDPNVRKDVSFYAVHPKTFEINVFEGQNPQEPNEMIKLPEGIGAYGFYGLKTNSCKIIQLFERIGENKYYFTIFTPAQALDGANRNGYDVLEQNDVSMRYTFPKIQTLTTSNMKCASNVLNFDINFKDISDRDAFLLTSSGQLCSGKLKRIIGGKDDDIKYIDFSSGISGCIINTGALDIIHQKFHENITFSIENPIKQLQITTLGQPISTSLKSGLSNFSISMNEGVPKYNYEFSSKPQKPPSSDFMLRQIEIQKKLLDFK